MKFAGYSVILVINRKRRIYEILRGKGLDKGVF